MILRRWMVPAAVLVLAACGGGNEAEDEGAAGDATSIGPAPGDSAAMTPDPVDTAGMGAAPPATDGALVDTAAVPMSPDTSRSATTPP